MTDRELIDRLLFLAQTAVDQALDLNYDDPEDYFIYRELRELKAAALAQLEPQGPSDEDLHQLWLDLYAFHDGPTSGDVAEIARAVLTRWGRAAIEPVPVSDPPGPEDCDAEGQCWLWRTDGIEEFWELVIPSYNIHEYNWTSQWKYTHWLPHWALPVPGVEGEP
jgi:hypothetical protein